MSLEVSLLLMTCVGQTTVQGDESPVSGVAQGVQIHGIVWSST